MYNKVTLSRNKKLISISDIVIVLLFVPMFVTGYIARYNMLYGLIYIAAFFLLCILLTKKLGRRLSLKAIDIIWLLTLIPLIYNSYAIEIGEYGVTIRYVVILLFILYFKDKYRYIDSMYKIIMYFSMFYIATTLIFNIIPPTYSILEFLVPKSTIQGVVNSAKSGFTNHYSTNAIYISLGCGIIISKCVNKNISLCKKVILLSLGTLALIFTTKRGNLIAFIFTAILIYYLYQANRPKSRISKMLLLLIGGTFILWLVVTITPIGDSILSRFNFQNNNFMSGRDKLYGLAWSMFQENEVFGIGWGRFKHLSYLAYITSPDTLLDAHNVYLNLLCETGIVGTFIYILAFVSTLKITVKLYINSRKNKVDLQGRELQYLTFALYIQIYFLIYCFTGNPLYDVQMLYPYMASIMIVLSIKNNVERRKKYG